MKKTFYDILKEIEKSPASFGIEKIEDFRAFLFGIETALNLEENEISDADYLDFSGFNDWARNYYNISVNFELHIDWIGLIRLHSTDNATSLSSFFSLLEKYKNRYGKVPPKQLTILEKSITVGLQPLFQSESFEINRNKSNQDTCFIENSHCGIEIRTTRYFDGVVIIFHDLKTRRRFDFFSILQVMENKSPILSGHLQAVSSIHAKSHFFAKRFIPFQNLNHPRDLEKGLKIICPIIQYELTELMYGDFSFSEKLKPYYAKRLKFKFSNKEQESEFERDLKSIALRKPFPEHKVISEVENYLKKLAPDKLSNFTQYKLREEEENWIKSLSIRKRSWIKVLSCEYIDAFEHLFNLSLPREYKLLLNYIGNGAGIIKLERSIVLYDYDTDTIHDYIDLNKVFSEQRKPLNITGAIKIHDYGCGIGHFIIVGGVNKGEIWIDDRANSGMIYPFKKENNQRGSFKDWIRIFGLDRSYASPPSPAEKQLSLQPDYDAEKLKGKDFDLPF